MEQGAKATHELREAQLYVANNSDGDYKEVMKKRHILVAIVTVLSACSIHSTGVVPNGEDRYKVTHLNGSASVSTDS